MYRPTTMRAMTFVLLGALATASVPLSADQTIKCESRDYRYRYCPAKTENHVELKKELSSRRCTEWRTWGYDNQGVWVDGGCRAEFKVGTGMGTGSKVAIIGGVAAAAVIAGILIAKKDDDTQKLEVPEWAVGMFRGWDEQNRTSIELTIGRDGTVAGWWQDQDFTGRWQNDRVNLGASQFKVSRDGDGLLLRDVRDERRTINMWRVY